MASARAHYDELLGSVYAWMVGDFDAAAARHAALYRRHGLVPGATGRAVDLGAGHGSSTLPLAELGFEVIAIDFCQSLLDELAGHCRGRKVRALAGEIVEFDKLVADPVDAIVCVGDTLTHLPDSGAVDTLLGAVHRRLAAGGRFVASFRDYVSRELEGADRFIPVRADADRILTCMLEYQPGTVTVYDLLHERTRNGGFSQRVSSYRKLRLAPAALASLAEARGLAVERAEATDGMVHFVARRP